MFRLPRYKCLSFPPLTYCKVCSMFFFTVRNVVAERLCFHRRLSFCSQGGCILACTGADTLRQTPPLWQTHSPPPTATAADGMHPTGMHSCFQFKNSHEDFLLDSRFCMKNFELIDFVHVEVKISQWHPWVTTFCYIFWHGRGGIQSPLKLWRTLAFLSSLIYNYQDLDHRPMFA